MICVQQIYTENQNKFFIIYIILNNGQRYAKRINNKYERMIN